jgi:hypothetical protein
MEKRFVPSTTSPWMDHFAYKKRAENNCKNVKNIQVFNALVREILKNDGAELKKSIPYWEDVGGRRLFQPVTKTPISRLLGNSVGAGRFPFFRNKTLLR